MIIKDLTVRFGDHVVLDHLDLEIKDKGLTLEGAAKRLAGERKNVINKTKVLESLKDIRKQLSEIRAEL